jgi:hypothetical protein
VDSPIALLGFAFSTAIKHKTVTEIWYCISGRGSVWRKLGQISDTIAFAPGACLNLPVGTEFQFRNDGADELRFLIATIPPWPGADEAVSVADHWERSFRGGADVTQSELATKDKLSVGWVDIYREICISVRSTDDVSFKLLGLVPAFAAAGAGLLTLLADARSSNSDLTWTFAALGVLGCAMTFAMLQWELRNIQKCGWLIDQAAGLEKYALGLNREPIDSLQHEGWKRARRAPVRWKWPWGKTEAEFVVYVVAMIAWLTPVAFAVDSALRT